MPTITTKNIVFIDSRVANSQTLLNGLTGDTEVFMRDAATGGQAQIVAHLLAAPSNLTGVAALGGNWVLEQHSGTVETQVRYSSHDADTLAEFAIALTGVTSLTFTDFVL